MGAVYSQYSVCVCVCVFARVCVHVRVYLSRAPTLLRTMSNTPLALMITLHGRWLLQEMDRPGCGAGVWLHQLDQNRAASTRRHWCVNAPVLSTAQHQTQACSLEAARVVAVVAVVVAVVVDHISIKHGSK